MSQRSITITLSIILIAMSLVPQVYLPCGCTTARAGQSAMQTAPCCSVPETPVGSCCTNRTTLPSEKEDHTGQNQICTYCMCDQQFQPTVTAPTAAGTDEFQTAAAKILPTSASNTDFGLRPSRTFFLDTPFSPLREDILLKTTILLI